jgi:hypothetical protein
MARGNHREPIRKDFWNQTTVGQGRTAERLGMKSADNAGHQLRRGLEQAFRLIPRTKLEKCRKRISKSLQ